MSDFDDDMNMTDTEDDEEYDNEYNSDDDDIALETNDHNNSDTKDTDCDYTIMTSDMLEKEMKKSIVDVQNVLQVPPGMCRILLHKYHWNKESLLERFYEHPDTNAFLIDAQVIPSLKGVDPVAKISECDICCTNAELTGLSCNHRACVKCWRQYLNNKIMTVNTSEIECMATGCKLLIEDERVMNYIRDEKTRSTYLRLVTSSFVETNRLLRWCPGIDCGRAVKVAHSEPRLIVCTCGSRYCFACGNDWHEPVNCRLLKLWLKKCNDDSETSNWINANTKECPKCNITIEKDGGCNHMSCKNIACRFEFCWMCLGPWEPHGSSWYSCNRFDDSAAKDARSAQEISRAMLQRYLFYYNRYMGHQQSLRLEGKLYSAIRTKMEHMQQLAMSWIEVQFLKKAVDVLSECRRTLMFTYAFAYYLKKDNNAEIFEENQKDLEMETEKLSEFLERDMESENLVTLKQKVQDKYRYVDHRRKILLSHCQEGAERDQWVYNE